MGTKNWKKGPAEVPTLIATIELPDRRASEPDTFEDDEIIVHVKECGAIVVFVGNQREQYGYNRNDWSRFTVAEVKGDHDGSEES